jgi:hypothetical protein
MIYDRDLQSIVDKIYPEFIAFEKTEEIEHYNKLKIPLKSTIGKHDRDTTDEQQSDRKRAKSKKDDKDSKEDNSDELPPNEASKKSDFEFTVKLNPCEECEEATKLPTLAKRLCKVSFNVRVLKIKKFVHKRLTDSEQETVQPEGIELLFNNVVLADESKLSYLRKEIEAAIDAKLPIEFVYRRKNV